VRAAPPSPEGITPQLIEAARKEGKVIWYTSVDLQVAETISKAFEEKFPTNRPAPARSTLQQYTPRAQICMQFADRTGQAVTAERKLAGLCSSCTPLPGAWSGDASLV
jgi:hypothetical protein